MPKNQMPPQTEAKLLQKLNHGVPPAARQRYIELNAKLHDETLTPAGQEELLK